MSIREQLGKIASKEIVVPEFQREYVWNKQQAKELFESLYKKWPTGGFLFWKVKKNKAPAIKNIVYTEKDTDRVELILDGQQRLTALYLLIENEIPPYYMEKDIKYDPRNLYFNILNETFQYYQKTIMDKDSSWNKLSWYYKCTDQDIEELCIKIEKLKGKPVSSTVWRVYSKLKNLLEYKYPVQTIPENVNELTAITIFDKINTQGTKLTSEELALAHVQSNWNDARKELKKYQATLKINNFEFDLAFYIRSLTAVVTQSGRPETIHNIKENVLVEGWNKVIKSLDYLIKILPTEAYIDSNSDLISSRTLIPIVAYLSKNNYYLSPKEKREFLRWLYLANLWSIY